MLEFDNQDSIELEYRPELAMLEVRWLEALNKNAFSKMWWEIAEAVNRHGVKNIILDATHVQILDSSSSYDNHVQHNFLQKLNISTVEKIAWICSGNAQYDQDMTNRYRALIKQNFSSITFESFQHYYEAMHWIN